MSTVIDRQTVAVGSDLMWCGMVWCGVSGLCLFILSLSLSL